MAETVNIETFPARIATIAESISLIRGYLDIDALQAEVARLEGVMQEPGFWDDQTKAAGVSADHSRAQRKLEVFGELEAESADLEEMAEMAQEDVEMASELEAQLDSIERRLADLEEARLFSGPYDAGDAIVSVHAGAGGTDSQDWAEMLLRMYLRWAERRGFQVEMKEASEGEEAGLKSATFILRGDNAPIRL